MNRFQDAIDYLYSFVSYEQKANWDYNNKTFNLDRFKEFLTQLGNPQHHSKAIHVAGSDGKGSTCVMIASVLRSMGYKTGLYLSPHLHDIRERIRINDEWISKEAFADWIEFMQKKNEEHPPLPSGYATFFELMTAMAFLHFDCECVDFAVIETGLGGRLDATNVMNPLLTVITHISKEHTKQLGDSLEQIANEKLGITRPGVPVVIGSQTSSLLPHIDHYLQTHQTPAIFIDRDYSWETLQLSHVSRTLAYVQKGSWSHQTICIPLVGSYQAQNAITALAALRQMERDGHIRPIEEETLQSGFGRVQWEGRFEIHSSPGQPTTILDVAHTAKAAAALRTSLDELYPHQRRIFVLGFLQDKNVREIVQALIRPEDRIILTKAPTPRGKTIEAIEMEIEDLIGKAQIMAKVEDPMAACTHARATASEKECLIITGSLYLIGLLRKEIIN
jgi:dihydrofolate synthase / folylpolyglutamate synthase